MRTWGSFRMILNTKNRQAPVTEAFDGMIVEIDTVNGYVAWKGIGIHSKAVVLAGNFNAPCLEILHGLIPSTMSKFQFKRLSSQRET